MGSGPIISSIALLNQPTLAALCVAVRIIQGLLINTAFNPDEVWQNQSIAYSVAFHSQTDNRAADIANSVMGGNMFRSWEWQDYAQIRTFTHPFLTLLFYRIIIAFGVDTPWLVAWGPRIWHSLICGLADSFLVRLVSTLINFLPQMYMELYLSPPPTTSLPPPPQSPTTGYNGVSGNNNDDNNELESAPLIPRKSRRITQQAPDAVSQDQHTESSPIVVLGGKPAATAQDTNDDTVWFFRTSLTPFSQFLQSIPAITLLLWLFNWFSAYCYPRAFSNSIETALIIIALSFWPFFYYHQPPSSSSQRPSPKLSPQQHPPTTDDDSIDNNNNTQPDALLPTLSFAANLTISLSFAALSVMFRATAVLLWAPLYLIAIVQLVRFSSKSVLPRLTVMIIAPIVIGLIALLAMVEIDSIGYQRPSPFAAFHTCLRQDHYTTTPTTLTVFSHILSCLTQNYPPHILSLYNFYKVNKAHNIASLYGENTPLFSLIVSIPVTTGALLPFLILSAIHFGSVVKHFWSNPTPNSPLHILRLGYLFCLAFFLPFFYCTNAHQEYRFILPAVPFLYLFAAHSIAYFYAFPPTSWSDITEFAFLTYPSQANRIRSKSSEGYPRERVLTLLTVLATLNLIATGLLFRLHQRGPYVLMEELHKFGSPLDSGANPVLGHKKLGVLLPGCHQVPYPTFFHQSDHDGPATQFEFYQPDCSPLFSRTRPGLEATQFDHRDGDDVVNSVPCWLNQFDQFQLLGQSSTHYQLNADCSSDQRTRPHFPGRNWVSGHEQSKSHPLLFFLRHVVVANLVQLEGASDSNDSSHPGFHFDPKPFYCASVSRYTKTLTDALNGVGTYSKHDDIVLLRSLLDSITLKADASTNNKNNHSNLSDLDKITALATILQKQRLSQNPNLNTFSSAHLLTTDPFLQFSTHFSFPTTTTTHRPVHLHNLFFPDIIVLYTQEQEILHPTLLRFGYTLHRSLLHTLTEPDERELFIYAQPGV